MTHYIDADRLTRAIEEKGLDCSFDLKMERLDTLALIDELQQEQPKVNLITEYDEQFDSDPVYGKLANRNAGIAIARHFYELGRNARKEE